MGIEERRNFVIGSVVSIITLIAYFVISFNDFWPESKLDAGAISGFCERAADGLILEPINTFSNLAFVGVGLFLLYRSDDLTEVGGNSFSRSGSILPIYAYSILAIGLGSFIMHGSRTELGGFLDWAGMLAFIVFPALYRIRSYLNWPENIFCRNYLILIIVLITLEFVRKSDDIAGIGEGLRRFGFYRHFIWASLIAIWMILELRIITERKNISSNQRLMVLFGIPLFVSFFAYSASQTWTEYFLYLLILTTAILVNEIDPPEIIHNETKWLYYGSATFFVSLLIIWELGKENSAICYPDSVFQLHALWHILCASATYFFYRHFLQERELEIGQEE